MKKALALAIATVATASAQQANAAYDFFHGAPATHKYSVSAGWLHAAPTGDANPMKTHTIISNGTVATNGASSSTQDVINSVDPTDPNATATIQTLQFLQSHGVNTLPEGAAGTSTVNGLESWTSAGTGLEAKNADTLGLLFDYHINDKWTAEVKAGIPPNVDIKGKGQVYAPFSGVVTPGTALIKPFAVKKDFPITNMAQGDGVASTARAWLPAAELQYHFDNIKGTKFRPYVGAGVMYAYFDKVKVAKGVEKDLKVAGQRIQLIKDGQAGASLADTIAENGTMKVNAKAGSSFAPLVTLGGTYDINAKWYAVGSVSYAKLNNDTTITVTNKTTGEDVIKAKTKIDIDPFITYFGFGYRF